MESETNSDKRKTSISFRSRRKLVNYPYISTKCSSKEGYMHVYELFQKFKHFPNNILGVSPEKLFSKCNEQDFLTSI